MSQVTTKDHEHCFHVSGMLLQAKLKDHVRARFLVCCHCGLGQWQQIEMTRGAPSSGHGVYLMENGK